jgi:hypothetical protein
MHVATHLLMVVKSTTGEPYALVSPRWEYLYRRPNNELTAPEPTPELTAELETVFDPLPVRECGSDAYEAIRRASREKSKPSCAEQAATIAEQDAKIAELEVCLLPRRRM